MERLVGKRPFEGLTTLQAHMSGTDRSQTLSEVEPHVVGHTHDNGNRNGQSAENKDNPAQNNDDSETSKKEEPERKGTSPGQTYSFEV